MSTALRDDLVLFDTNVWRHLIGHERAMATRAALRAAGLKGAVSPLVVDELVRTPNGVHMRAMVDIATRQWWVRLLPIGLLDVEQLVDAIRRHRAEWLRPDPDRKRYSFERGAYVNNTPDSYWNVVRKRPREWAEANSPNDVIRTLQQATTLEARELVPHFDSTRVAEAMAAPMEVDLRGTDLHGRLIESWRFQCANSVWVRLDPRQTIGMVSIWFDCFVDRARISPSDWWAFWADAVEPADVSREWLRCATFHLQAARKVGNGVAGDLAVVSHLVDVGTFATCDKPLYDIVERLRPAAPFGIARVVHGHGIEELLGQLTPGRPTDDHR